MQPESGTALTDAQEKAYAENEADFAKLDQQIRSVQEAATARLSAIGLRFDEDSTACLLCGCDAMEGPGADCDNCGHRIWKHRGGT
jgi:hypothetical protein